MSSNTTSHPRPESEYIQFLINYYYYYYYYIEYYSIGLFVSFINWILGYVTTGCETRYCMEGANLLTLLNNVGIEVASVSRANVQQQSHNGAIHSSVKL